MEKIDKRQVSVRVKELEDKMSKRLKRCMLEYKKDKRYDRQVVTGRILHLDGDKRYSDKSNRFYKSLGLEAIVKNVPENKQALVVKNLLEKYKPDVLILTRT